MKKEKISLTEATILALTGSLSKKQESEDNELNKSMNALDKIDKIAGNNEYLARKGKELGLQDFKKFLKDNPGIRESIKAESKSYDDAFDPIYVHQGQQEKHERGGLYFKESGIDRHSEYDYTDYAGRKWYGYICEGVPVMFAREANICHIKLEPKRVIGINGVLSDNELDNLPAMKECDDLFGTVDKSYLALDYVHKLCKELGKQINEKIEEKSKNTSPNYAIYNKTFPETESEDNDKEDNLQEKKEIKEERLNFKAAGIERDPRYDFYDDGSKFLGYTCEDIPISYLRYDGDVYIAIQPDAEIAGVPATDLTYDELHELPFYKEIDKYNGVPESEVDLNDIVRICKEARKQIDEKEASLGKIEDSEYKELADKIDEVQKQRFEKAKEMIPRDDLLEYPDYSISNILRYLKQLKTYANTSIWNEMKKHDQTKRREMMHTYKDEPEKFNNLVYECLQDTLRNIKKEESRESDMRAIRKILDEGKKELDVESFNKSLLAYFNKSSKLLESVDVTEIKSNKNSLIIEAKLINKQNLSRKVNLEFAKTCESKYGLGAIYSLKSTSGLLKENKQSKLILHTFVNSKNLIECKIRK